MKVFRHHDQWPRSGLGQQSVRGAVDERFRTAGAVIFGSEDIVGEELSRKEERQVSVARVGCAVDDAAGGSIQPAHESAGKRRFPDPWLALDRDPTDGSARRFREMGLEGMEFCDTSYEPVGFGLSDPRPMVPTRSARDRERSSAAIDAIE